MDWANFFDGPRHSDVFGFGEADGWFSVAVAEVANIC
jgi:hypothetical protein